MKLRSTVLTAHDFVSDAAAVVGAFVHTQNPANPRETTYFDLGDHKVAAATDDEKNRGRCEKHDIDLRERPAIDVHEVEQDDRELRSSGETVSQMVVQNLWPGLMAMFS